MSQHPAPIRRRALREDVIERRRALLLVQPLTQQLGGWQIRLARLTSRCERAAGRDEAAVLQRELDELEALVVAELDKLRSLLDQHSEVTRLHGQVQDANRAADSVLAGTGRAKAILAGSPSGDVASHGANSRYAGPRSGMH